ncbi:DUF7255 family protein [Algoriphagus sp. PAP.12]|uniref:DUF7255 family protein n=1 Tax=Algoriphagus sp. PAP.12 TaxID=2996678 RepID=UPI00227C85E0|nr:hypothetical protein [Algoriphagus sp. PAP.12]
MQHIFVENFLEILRNSDVDLKENFELEVNPKFLDQKGKNWLQEVFEDLGGEGKNPLLEKLKFDWKINRFLFLFDFHLHFNRYRLTSFRSDLYREMNFPFVDAQRRLCRTYEKECLKAGMQSRIWNGPPIAQTWFGAASEPGDFSGNGAPGWKLQAYNDVQIDLQTRIHGYKLVRLSPYETIMTGGSLKRLDQLLVNPNEEQQQMLLNWFMRKLA